MLLDAAEGTSNAEIARRHPVSVITVRAWRTAFDTDGLTGWGKVKKGRGPDLAQISAQQRRL